MFERFDSCQHGDCGFQARLEYCEQQAPDPESAVAPVIDLLEALLYDSGAVTSDRYALSADRDGLVTEREFSYVHGDVKSWIWPLTETTVAITHTQDKQLHCDQYGVRVSWAVQQAAVQGSFVTDYSLEVYPHGPVQTAIEQPSFERGGRQSRPMTAYDHESLFTELGVIYDLHTAERGDNARAV